MTSLRRRDALKVLAGAATGFALNPSSYGAPLDTPANDPGAETSKAVKNRAPLAPNAFNPLPLGCVRPSGWLRRQLLIQANGLGGHLDETWADVGPNSGWLGGTGESWERGPYFLDGLLPLAYLLDDAHLKAKAKKFLDWTLASQAPTGMFGPAKNDDWWPRMVMLKVLAQFHEVTGDPRVIPLMSRYFAHQLQALPLRPLRDWGKFRWQDNALVAIWLYNRTGEPKLLDLVRLLHAQGFDWQRNFAEFPFTQPVTRDLLKAKHEDGLGDFALASHGVNNGQAIKAAPVWSLLTGSAQDRAGLRQMLDTLDRFHGLPNGMFSCDEHLAGRNPSQGSELCTVVEAMYSLEQSIAILGDPELGDRLERLAFNALPGTFTDDMWAHQYNQEPNQVEVSLHNKPWTTDGPESNLFGLEPNFGCCTANFHQGWPKFVAGLWMASADDGLVAVAYSPCEVHTQVGETTVRLSEQTDYPFDGTIRIAINPAKPLRFPLRLRIPGWAKHASVTVNGISTDAHSRAGFAKIERLWKSGDVVEITFPMTPRLAIGYQGSGSMERGPLVFSFPIGENWVKLRDRTLTADWQVFPSTAWNYALAVDDHAASELRVERAAVGASPFARESTPVKLQVPVRKVPQWRAVDGVAEEVPASPVASDESEEIITLVPYAAAKLRITSFPRLKV